MTRLAIIFSLLFATPAWAEIRAMSCRQNVPFIKTTVVSVFKYEEGLLNDKCYARTLGKWIPFDEISGFAGHTAKDWACIQKDETGTSAIDFITYRWEIIPDRGLPYKCESIDIPD